MKNPKWPEEGSGNNQDWKVVEMTRTIQTCVQILILPYPGHVLGQVT